ncbi:MAG: hypothetical protein II973_04545 [Spirochaetaceae bacterium]|nr:hypothetical protein [Spirochaetaceae bacterium]
MESYILIAEKSFSFESLKDLLQKKFTCYEVSNSRLTVESGDEHIFIDFDDDMREDYDDEKIRASDFHFFSVSYSSRKFAKSVISEAKDFAIRVDDDNGTILPIKDFVLN